jgi:hypothetical protein
VNERIPCGYTAWLAEQQDGKPSYYESKIAAELEIGPATETELRIILAISGTQRQRFDAALCKMRAKGRVRTRKTFTPEKSRRLTQQPLDVIELVAVTP